MSSKSNARLPREPLTSNRIAFLRPVAKRVASKVASPPPLSRARKIAASSTVTCPRPVPTSADSPCTAPGSGRSCTKVSIVALTPVRRSPVTKWVRSMTCAPMSPRAPDPARSLSSRQLSGICGSTSQSCRYCARTWRISPMRPSCTSCRASAMAGTRRYVNPTIDRMPCARASSAAAAMARASATVFASGFSQSTCLPARRAAMAISAWVSPGVQMSTRSTSGRATSARQSVSTCCQSNRRAISPAAAPSRPPMATRSGTRGGSKKDRALRQPCEWATPMNA